MNNLFLKNFRHVLNKTSAGSTPVFVLKQLSTKKVASGVMCWRATCK